MSKVKRSLAETHPEIAEKWHKTLNGNLTPKHVTAGSKKEAWFYCKKGKWPDGTASHDHVYKQRISDAANEAECPCCLNRKVVPSNCLETTHPEIAEKWHKTLNGNLTPKHVTYGSELEAWFYCGKGQWPDGTPSYDHVYKQKIYVAAREGECPCCLNRKVVPSNCLETTHPEIAEKWHKTLNGNLTAKDVTYGSMLKIWLFCDKGQWPDGTPSYDHVYKIILRNATTRLSCPCCTNRKVVPSNCLETTHPEIAKKWHKTLNGDLTPRDVTYGSDKYAYFSCDKGHVLKCRIRKFIENNYCRFCPNENISKLEKSVRNYFQERKIIFKQEVAFSSCKHKNKLPFDFMAKHNFGFLIECQGEGHYFKINRSKTTRKNFQKLINTIKHDHIKFKWCCQKSVPLLIIPYWDAKRIPEILEDFIAGKTPDFSKPPEIVQKNLAIRQKIRSHLGIKEPEVLYGTFNHKLKLASV